MTFEEYVNSSAFEAEVRDTGEKRKRNIVIVWALGVIMLVLSIALVVIDFLPDDLTESVPALDYIFIAIAVADIAIAIPVIVIAKKNNATFVSDHFFLGKLLFIRESLGEQWKGFIHNDVLEVRINVERINGDYVKKIVLYDMSGEIPLNVDAWKGRAGVAEFIDAVHIGMLEYVQSAVGRGKVIRHVHVQTCLDGMPLAGTKGDPSKSGTFFMSNGKWTTPAKSALKRLQKYKNKYNID